MIFFLRAKTAAPVGNTIASAIGLIALTFVLGTPAGMAQAVEVQKVVSAQGIEAWLVEEDTVPLIAISFAFVGGAAQDPAHLPGVANMLSGLLDEGAGDLDSAAFQNALDEFSIELSFDADRDTFGGSVRTLVENRDEAARLLRLALTEPRFDPQPVERIRAQIVADIRSDERDPDNVAADALIAATFPDHAYGRPVEGTLDSVAAITVDDLRTFHGKNIARDNLKIAVVGALDAGALARLLDEVFGSLPVKANLNPIRNVEPTIGERHDITMNIPQTVLLFAANGVVRSDPDFVPAAVALHILGGGSFSSRLYAEVREKRGFAYSIGLGLRAYDHAGLVVGSTRTRADQADRVVALIESEISRFVTEGATEDELAEAKSYLTGSYALRFTTSTRITRQLLAIQLDDLGIDYVNRRNDLIAAVTGDDIKRVTRRLFGGGEDLTVVQVGQPAS
jgi:zinc protease